MSGTIDDLRRAFWASVAIFAWRRLVRPGEPKPWGIPGNRDPENVCDAYEPRKSRLNDWTDCLTDGHALCKECCHRDTTRTIEDLPSSGWLGVYEVRGAKTGS
jgi:hypothetical protein